MRRKFLICALFFISSHYLVISQNLNPIYIPIDSLEKLVVAEYTKGEIKAAVDLVSPVVKIYKSRGEWESSIKAYNFLAVLYYDKRNLNISKYEEAAFKAYDIAKEKLNLQGGVSAQAINNLAVYYYTVGNFPKAIELCKIALEMNVKENASMNEIGINYTNLGNYFKYNNDHENAVTYLRKALKIELDSFPDRPEKIAASLHAIGEAFNIGNQRDSTIFYFQKVEDLIKDMSNSGEVLNLKIETYLSLAELWIQNKNYQKTNGYFDKVQELSLNDYFSIQLQETLGKSFIAQEKYSEAVNVLNKGESLAIKHNQRNTPTLKARRLIELANAYYLSGDPNNALSSYQKALIGLSPGFDSEDYKDNPKPDKFLDRPDALTLLNGKAALLFELYQAKKETNHLTAAYDTYLLAAYLIRDIRQGILSVESKNSLAEKTVPVYEGAIKTALELYARTGDAQYKTSAFQLAESNKALLLLESINEQSAKGFAGIPDSLLDEEKDLKLNLAYLQNELLNNKASGGAVKNIEDQIFDLNQKLDRLISGFEKNYPRYFELKYQNEPTDLKVIQQYLASTHNALLEYFVGEQAIYLFVLTSESLEVQTIENPALVFDAIRQLRPILNNPPGSADPRAEFVQFTSAAHGLYSLLLQTTLEQLPESISGLIIIPDDQLNYIPFDILLTEAASQDRPSYTIADLAYLMERFPVNYHYSATLLHKSQQRNKNAYAHDFIGFAPSFKEANAAASRACSGDELYSLQCSGDEVASINQLLGGTTYIDEKATKSIFEQEAAAYRIIHLATHACVDENNSNLNKIFLTDDFLSSYDLYNMALNSELAVLSACNTGSGELVKGEGVMNMARGFINAGCSSALMSIWSVDDCATSDIMLRFYQGLKKGLNKDEALRSAKLGYLDSVAKTKMHPYYWAAFVPFGDMAAMEIGGKSNLLYFLLPVVLMIMLLFFIRLRK